MLSPSSKETELTEFAQLTVFTNDPKLCKEASFMGKEEGDTGQREIQREQCKGGARKI